MSKTNEGNSDDSNKPKDPGFFDRHPAVRTAAGSIGLTVAGAVAYDGVKAGAKALHGKLFGKAAEALAQRKVEEKTQQTAAAFLGGGARSIARLLGR